MAGRGSAKPGDTEGMGMTAVQTAPVGAKTVWKLDPAHTLVEFSAKHLMISTVKGRIAGVDGIIRIDDVTDATKGPLTTPRRKLRVRMSQATSIAPCCAKTAFEVFNA